MTSCRCRSCRVAPRPVRGWQGCSVARCARPVHCRGLCRRHYDAARYRGRLTTTPCATADCAGVAISRGLCGHCYNVARYRESMAPTARRRAEAAS